MFRRLPLVIGLGLTLSCALAQSGPQVKLTPLADRVRVEIDGRLFTEYIYGDGASRPYLYPVLAADGTPLTRGFPMEAVPGEDDDHPWHRSLFFAHSVVNGVDFWNEGTGDAGRSPAAKGKTVTEAPVVDSDGETGVLQVRDRWIAPDGRLVCTDTRTLRFRATTAGRFIDYEVTWHAPAGEPLLFGDNKDGTMAIRLAQWMTLPHKFQGRDLPGAGHIVTSAGRRDAEAWGTRGDWCDYHAPHHGQTYGVAIFDHPQNLRHPTWWMARDYGLFAANPFGRHDFEGLKDQPHVGDYALPAGGSLTLRYRFYFHTGDEVAAEVAARYADYIAEK